MTETIRPRLADATQAAANRAAARVRVCVLAQIVSYDSAETSATVRPCVREQVQTADGLVWADALEIPGVPVCWPGDADGVALTWPLPVGAIVPVLFRDRSHDEVDAGNAVPTAPASVRRWDLADGLVLPFAWSARDPLPSGAQASSGVVARLPVGASLLVGDNAANKALALAQETAARIERIEAYLNTATYATPAGPTTAPSPLPFTGATSTAPICTASVVVGSVPATTTAAVQTTRIKVDSQ